MADVDPLSQAISRLSPVSGQNSSGVNTVLRSAEDRLSLGAARSSSSVLTADGLDAWSSFVPNSVLHQMNNITTSDGNSELPPLRTFEAATLFADASGFTALTEKLAQHKNGAELMCEIMNRFIGAVIQIVHQHGGDVVKFAGDAVSCIFEVGDVGGSGAAHLQQAVGRATCCALELHRKLHNFVGYDDGTEASRVLLCLHIGVGCGTVTMMHLGGHHGRWEYVLAGDPQNQATEGEPLATSGETCLSPQAWAIVQGVATGTRVAGGSSAGEAGEAAPFMLVTAIDVDAIELSLGPHVAAPLRMLRAPEELLPLLRRYVPSSVAAKLHGGVRGDADLSEMRQVSVVFLNCVGLRLAPAADGDWSAARAAGQAVMACVQEEVHHAEGQVNKMLVDDKGTIFLCAFGLPPRPHSDDAFRAVRTSLVLAATFSGARDEFGGTRACIGVGSGRAFAGVVGASGDGLNRREFTTMGDCVNVAARMMGLASKPGATRQVLMDEDTKESVKELVFFEALPETRLKGKADPIALFAPLKEKPKKAGSTSVARSGRDEEYWRLRGVVAELLVYQEQSGLILLIGGRGSGKNILVQALESFGAEAGMVVLRGVPGKDDGAAGAKHRRSVGTASGQQGGVSSERDGEEPAFEVWLPAANPNPNHNRNPNPNPN